MCAICKVDTGSYNLNYGANTCLSCRAFFRRAIQKNRNPQFSCKAGGNCEISEATRRACKACRYDACLRAGMMPDCVMKGTEVQQRFSKYIQRKKGIDKKATTMASLLDARQKGTAKKERRKRQRQGQGGGKGKAGGRQDLLKMAVKEIMGYEQQERPTAMFTALAPSRQVKQEQEPSPSYSTAGKSPSSGSYYSDDVMLSSPSVVSPSNSAPAAEEKPLPQQSQQQQQQQQDAIGVDGDIAVLFDLDLLPKEEPPTPSPTGAVSIDSGHESSRMGDLSSDCSEELPAVLFEEVIHQDEGEEGKEKEEDEEGKDRSERSKERRILDVGETVEKVRLLRQSWARACEENRPSNKTVGDVLGALSTEQKLPASVLEDLRSSYLRVFDAFASKQRSELSGLSQSDRGVLVEKNGQLFVHYIFGQVLGADTIEIQLQWLLQLDAPPSLPPLSMVRAVTLQDLQQNFVDLTSRDQYLSTSFKLASATAPFGFGCGGAAALTFLLNTEGGLEDALAIPKSKVDDLRKLAMDRAEWTKEAYSWAGEKELSEVLAAVLNLYQLSKSNILMVDCQRILSMPELRGIFAAAAAGKEQREEEEWVAKHLVDYDLVFNRISFGPEFVKECAMYSLGVPLSKHFIPQSTRLTAERLKAVMMHHHEFRDLPVAQREAAWEGGVLAGTAVVRAKLEACRCGNEQFDIAFGEQDKKRLAELFATQGHPPRGMCRISVAEWNKAFGLADANTMDRFIKLTRADSPLQELLRMEDGYKLTTLLAIFGLCRQPALESVALKYLRAVKRRLRSAAGEARIKQALCDAEELSHIMDMFARAV